jgi:hypothetical protein
MRSKITYADLWSVLLWGFMLMGRFDAYGWHRWLIPFIPYAVDLGIGLLVAMLAGGITAVAELQKDRNTKRRIAAYRERRK